MSINGLRHLGIVTFVAFVVGSCSSATEVGGAADFCMQWVNTSNRVVQFHAVDDVGDTLSVLTMMVPTTSATPLRPPSSISAVLGRSTSRPVDSARSFFAPLAAARC